MPHVAAAALTLSGAVAFIAAGYFLRRHYWFFRNPPRVEDLQCASNPAIGSARAKQCYATDCALRSAAYTRLAAMTNT
jgi:hypothetical protein